MLQSVLVRANGHSGRAPERLVDVNVVVERGDVSGATLALGSFGHSRVSVCLAVSKLRAHKVYET